MLQDQLNCKILAPDVAKLSRNSWLNLRRQFLGGSDISAALGLNRWRSPLEVWLDKTGQPIGKEVSEACRWGIILEEPIRAELSRRTGWLIEKPTAMFGHPAIPFLAANVDGIAEIPGKGLAVVEIKTASSYKLAEWQDGQIPVEYQLQGLHYLSCLGLDHCVFACLLGGQQLVIAEMFRDNAMIDNLHQLAADFWRCVTSGTPPEVDASAATAELLQQLFPLSSNPAPLILAEAADQWIENWQEAKEAEEAAAEQRRLAENKLKASLQDHERGVTPGGFQVNWKSVSATRLDTARIKAEEPSILERYTTTTASRRLSIQAKK